MSTSVSLLDAIIQAIEEEIDCDLKALRLSHVVQILQRAKAIYEKEKPCQNQ